jgi:hypothetical protein
MTPQLEKMLREEGAKVVGVDPIEEFKYEEKKVVIKRDIQDPASMRNLEAAMKRLGWGVVQM